MTTAPRDTPARVRFATPYLEVENQSIYPLERTIKRELAQATRIANANEGKRRDRRSSVQARLACPP